MAIAAHVRALAHHLIAAGKIDDEAAQEVRDALEAIDFQFDRLDTRLKLLEIRAQRAQEVS